MYRAWRVLDDEAADSTPQSYGSRLRSQDLPPRRIPRHGRTAQFVP